MKAMSKINFKSVLVYGGVFGGATALFYNIHKKIKFRTAVNNAVTEYCEMALRSDSRILNYCGNNFQINHYEIVTSERNSMTIRLQVNGIRGKCKVLAKCEKSSHKYLKSHFDQQIKFSLLSKEEKSMSPFTPINFNDVLIPDKKVIEKIKTISQDKEIFNYNIDKFNEGYYSKLPKLANEEVKEDDEFWRISSLVLISKDSMIFNVRPISNKLKNYDLEETFYKLNSYQDVISSVIEFKDKYIATINKKLTNEEFRREINQMKQSNLENRSKSRKGIMMVEALFFVGIFLVFRIYLTKTILNHPGYFQALKMIQNSSSVASFFGNQPNVVFDTGRVLFTKNVKFNIHVQGSKTNGIISFQANDEPDFIQNAKIKLRNNEEYEINPIESDEKNNKVLKKKKPGINFEQLRDEIALMKSRDLIKTNDILFYKNKKKNDIEMQQPGFFSRFKMMFSRKKSLFKV